MQEKIILVLIWVIWFTVWQYILKFYIEKYNNYLEIKLKIINYTRLQNHKISHFQIDTEISQELRQLSCDLYSNYNILPKLIKIFKKEHEIDSVIGTLLWLSNSISDKKWEHIHQLNNKLIESLKKI